MASDEMGVEQEPAAASGPVFDVSATANRPGRPESGKVQAAHAQDDLPKASDAR